MKRIAIFCDGTCDKPDTDSNVYRLFKAAVVSHDQFSYYHDGLGVDGLPIDRLLGAEFGLGLCNIIKSCYATLAHIYEAGDSIFLFGFSRGAFTARAISGMVSAIGLPSGAITAGFVDDAFEAYRDPEKRPDLTVKYSMVIPQITMVGVWDTVSAVGLLGAPDGGTDPLDGFIDAQLHPCIQNAFHALSIDEKRREFAPLLWAQLPAASNQVLDQTWYCGVHSDVGGGYSDGEIAFIPYAWMASKAAALGLVLTPFPTMPEVKFALAPIHDGTKGNEDSWSVLWGFPKHRIIPTDAVLANSVSVRMDNDPTYRPENLLETCGVLDKSYGVAQVTS